MKYNEKYDLYLDEDLNFYYWDKRKDKLMKRSICKHNSGYLKVNTKISLKYVHRIIWETFNGEIPDGYEIDHINTIKTDNRLENLRLVTHKENMNNSLTKQHIGETMKGNTIAKGHIGTTYRKGKIYSEFGGKFKEHYGISKYQNPKLYNKELCYYHYHHKCRWE